ncbi:MAG TPA: serine hydrolase domain-containing protein, partial [Myxococcaceae bacterium]|nr:serine hydrolase domain-containing protein [Myxococcaceae bacterium]
MSARALAPALASALLLTACSHPPATAPSAATQSERRQEWLVALRSDVERIAEADGFHGQLRVLHDGKVEFDRTFRPADCLPLGLGRRLLSSVAVALLVQDGALGFEDRLDRRLPALAGTSLAKLSVANLLTSSAGLAPASGASLDERLDAAGTVPLQGVGSRVDPADDRPWRLVERLVTQLSGEPYATFVARRVTGPAGMRDTALGPTPACAEPGEGTTTMDDQFRLIEALRAGTVVSPGTRDALWMPRLPLGAGVEVAYGFVVRS